MYKKISFLIVSILLFGIVASASADVLGEKHTFYVNPTYDTTDRTSVPATLVSLSDHAYYYVEDAYLNGMNPSERKLLETRIAELAVQFDSTIYPKETQFFGSEANPGIDNDSRITILFERLKSGTGGYFDSVNEYTPDQVSRTNQREMIVVSVLSLSGSRLKDFLAHEFQHLISFNQKELLLKVSEETWLNELRSQYAVSVAGYNNDFQNSDLYQRALTFLQDPTDSVMEWPNTLGDYSSVTLLGHYLVDRYGPSVLQETIKSPSIGIASLSGYLSAHDPSVKFSNIFADWVWANYVNNRALDLKFGYSNPNLQFFHVPPTSRHGLTVLNSNNFSYSLKPWQPSFYQFITDISAPKEKNIKISWNNPAFEVFYADTENGPRMLRDGEIILPPSSGNNFSLIPINISKTDKFTGSETPSVISLSIEYTDQPAVIGGTLIDGSLIKHAAAPDIYVVTGPYKRLLPLEVLKFYGLDAAKTITVSEAVFQSYMTANYIRAVNEKKVYAVWPDNTKHWLNMTAQHFTDSHRDWNSVFIVNDLESKFYSIGPDITQ